MTGFVLRRIPDGAYVSRPDRNPTGGSYTSRPEYARVFPTREAAEAERCVENERIVSVDEVVGRG